MRLSKAPTRLSKAPTLTLGSGAVLVGIVAAVYSSVGAAKASVALGVLRVLEAGLSSAQAVWGASTLSIRKIRLKRFMSLSFLDRLGRCQYPPAQRAGQVLKVLGL